MSKDKDKKKKDIAALAAAGNAYAAEQQPKEETKLINELSSITHAHPISQLGCRIYCDYLSYLMDGADKYYAYYMIQQNNYEKYYPKEVVDKYQRILDGSIIVQSASRISGSGYIVDTLEASIWASFNSESYEEALKAAIDSVNLIQ